LSVRVRRIGVVAVLFGGAFLYATMGGVDPVWYWQIIIILGLFAVIMVILEWTGGA
jgi:hypothetical protein